MSTTDDQAINQATNQSINQLTNQSINQPTNQRVGVTQSPNTINSADVRYRATFSSETVKQLTAQDFNLESKDSITLKYDDCILVLFYAENDESIQLINIWAAAAQQVAGPIFAAINILNERKVAEAFTRLKSSGSHGMHWASLKQFPFILIYRGGWPVAFYNGSREVQALIDYSLTLACEAGYYEHAQVSGSMQSSSRLGMEQVSSYNPIDKDSQVIRKTSAEYTSEAPIRTFLNFTASGATGTNQNITDTNQDVTGASQNIAGPTGDQGQNIATPADSDTTS